MWMKRPILSRGITMKVLKTQPTQMDAKEHSGLCEQLQMRGMRRVLCFLNVSRLYNNPPFFHHSLKSLLLSHKKKHSGNMKIQFMMRCEHIHPSFEQNPHRSECFLKQVRPRTENEKQLVQLDEPMIEGFLFIFIFYKEKYYYYFFK